METQPLWLKIPWIRFISKNKSIVSSASTKIDLRLNFSILVVCEVLDTALSKG